MKGTYCIDQAKTFTSLLMLCCEPKTAFGDQYRQETTKDGLPKWEAQFVAGFRQFGRAQNEIIKVGVAAERNPADSIPPYTPVELVGFEIGVMEKTRTNKETGQEFIAGVQVWYRCEEIRPTAATGSSGKRAQNAEAAAS